MRDYGVEDYAVLRDMGATDGACWAGTTAPVFKSWVSISSPLMRGSDSQ